MRHAALLFPLAILVGCSSSSSSSSATGRLEASCAGSPPPFARVADGVSATRVSPCGELLYVKSTPTPPGGANPPSAPVVVRSLDGVERSIDTTLQSFVFAATGRYATFFDRTTHETKLLDLTTGDVGTFGKPIDRVGFVYDLHASPPRAVAYGCGAQGLVFADPGSKPLVFDPEVRTCLGAAEAGPNVLAVHKDNAVVSIDLVRRTITPLAGAEIEPAPQTPQAQPLRASAAVLSADGARVAFRSISSVVAGGLTTESPVRLFDAFTGRQIGELDVSRSGQGLPQLLRSQSGGHAFVFQAGADFTIVSDGPVLSVTALAARPLADGTTLLATAGDGGARHLELVVNGVRQPLADTADLPFVSEEQRAFAANRPIEGDGLHSELVVWSGGRMHVVARTNGLAKVDWLGEDGAVVFDALVEDAKVPEAPYGSFYASPTGEIAPAPKATTQWRSFGSALVGFVPPSAQASAQIVAIDARSRESRVLLDLGSTYGQLGEGSKHALSVLRPTGSGELYWGAP
jgi:hypothetical protein